MPRYLVKRNDVSLKEELYKNVYISQNPEATKCPSIGKWIKELWYTHTTEHYLAMKRELIYAKH
jgi:hypothetical protein